MTNPTAVAQEYITLWNTTDPAARRALLDLRWCQYATYRDPLMSGDGLDRIDSLIAAMQAKYMPAMTFSLASIADGHGDHVRFTWGLGPENAPPIAKGTDVIRLEGGRIAEVTGFLDHIPA